MEVQADPKHPPHSLPALRKFLEDYGEVATKTMNRSSTAELPYDLKDFLPDFSSGSPDTNANFMMTLIWADGEKSFRHKVSNFSINLFSWS